MAKSGSAAERYGDRGAPTTLAKQTAERAPALHRADEDRTIEGMTFIEDLVESLDTRLEQLRAEMASLTHAREELISNGAARAHASRPKTQRQTRLGNRTRARRARAEPVSTSKLHSLLTESGGLTAAELSHRLDAAPARVLPLLRAMAANGSVRRSGSGRGSRWHAVANEEEWIAKRAAELAARRGS